MMVLAIAVSVAVAVCSLDHKGPMLGTAGHMGASGHSDSTVLGCGGGSCFTLISKAFVSPEKIAGFFFFPILFLSSWFYANARVNPDLSPQLQRFSFHPRLASNKRYRDLAVYRL
jgi:hypothetical protein